MYQFACNRHLYFLYSAGINVIYLDEFFENNIYDKLNSATAQWTNPCISYDYDTAKYKIVNIIFNLICFK